MGPPAMAFSLERRKSQQKFRRLPKHFACFFLLLLVIFLLFFLSNTCFPARKLNAFVLKNIAVRTAEHDAMADGMKSAEENIRAIRSWARAANVTAGGRRCDGRGIFVYELPLKFNKGLMAQCSELLPWADLCDFLAEDGFGLPFDGLGPGWSRTHQYSLEPIFHSRTLNHPCRVSDPAQARLFYVPFYAGLDVVRWHFAANASTEDKDALSGELLRWLEARPEWALRGGRDHMLVLGKISWDFRRAGDGPWGNTFLSTPQMRNPYKFLIERNPWEQKEIGVPHPTHFHPRSDDDIAAWQATISASARGTLVSFVGAARPESAESIREALIRQCTSSGGECQFVDCSEAGRCQAPGDVVEMFMSSEFCLQPPGDSPTRKSVFDGMVAGCIPVLFDPFTAYFQYPWHLPEDHQRYSVYVGQEDVREGRVDVVERLRAVPPDKRAQMRRYIIYHLMPGLVYGNAKAEFTKFRDAFDIVMDNMIQLIAQN